MQIQKLAKVVRNDIHNGYLKITRELDNTMNHTTSMQELIRLLPHWHYKVERSIRRQQKSRQISYETYFCLMTLKNCGQMKMGELAKAMRLSKQQATHMIDSLHRYGLVERSENPGDRRSIYIGITAQGFRFLKENALDATALYEQMLQKLSDREIAALEQAVHTMLEVLTKLD